ncbi:Rop family plasmid primer RNA-binding protein, partial [Escherichia coli]
MNKQQQTALNMAGFIK